MTNENVIDLYSRAKIGAQVVVLAPAEEEPATSPTVALTGRAW